MSVGPPRAGKNCRDRKIKCDMKRPSCSQCIRVQRTCHGYRDELALMFKNESDVVMTKALKRYEMLSHKTQKSRSTKQTNTWVAAPDSGSESSVASPQETITLPLTSPIEDQALCFFFANYKMEPSSVLRGQFEFLGPLLNRGDTEPILQRSVHAASLASLANNTKSAFAMKRARQEYGAALAMTNRALESRETAVKDSTLICIMMLGLYETLMYEGKDSLLTCPKHVAGACTLLSLRGQDNFKTDTGRRVFQQFHRVVLLAAFQTDLVMPTAMERMWEEAESRGVYQIRARTWSTRMIRWLHDMARLKQNKTTDSATMVARATKLAHEFNEIRALIPEIFQYDTVYLERPAEYVFGKSYHIYVDPFIVQFWNIFRSMQLGLHSILRAHLLKGLAPNSLALPKEQMRHQLQAAEEVIQNISAEICASVPQITGQIAFPRLGASTPSPTSTWPRTSAPTHLLDRSLPGFELHPPGTFLSAARPTGMQHLVFPLWAVGRHEPHPPGLTQWAIDRLQFIAHTIGSKQPLVYAQDLKQKLEQRLK